ncbi:MAG TPA: MFS transporter [Anaeromyxobacteraceae bacterium]|jgi:MFS family permease
MAWPHALRSLRHRNLRLFFGGQAVSLAGSWMQQVAQGWLVWRLTRSTELLGLVGFLGQIPSFLFGLWAGSLADRLPRRGVVAATQLNALVQAALLAALTLSGAVRPWHLLPLAFMLGLTYAFEIPPRQALLGDIAGEDMPNALALNASVVHGARLVGPAVAGWLVAAAGEGWCFALNALSFLATLGALAAMRVPARPPAPPAAGHLRDGLVHAVRAPHLRSVLLLLAAASFFGMPYSAMLPVLAQQVLGGDARLLGLLQASAGAGAFAGGVLLVLRRGEGGLGPRVRLGAACLGCGLAVAGLARQAPLACAGLALAGFGYVTQAAGTMTLLQALAPPELRGRLMGIFSTLFVGLSPFGALAMGFGAHRAGVPAVLVAGGAAVVAAAALFQRALPAVGAAERAAAVAAAGGPAP